MKSKVVLFVVLASLVIFCSSTRAQNSKAASAEEYNDGQDPTSPLWQLDLK